MNPRGWNNRDSGGDLNGGVVARYLKPIATVTGPSQPRSERIDIIQDCPFAPARRSGSVGLDVWLGFPRPKPWLFDLRADPYERADITSNTYYDCSSRSRT
jgi:hypothetical protein